MENDLKHMQDLCSLYYPTSKKIRLAANVPMKVDSQAATIPIRDFLPYKCCGKAFYDQSLSLEHYFSVHFTLIHNYIRNQPPSQFTMSALGNTSVHIFRRVQLFLNALSYLPKNPKHFRPSPHSKPPNLFTNPYSATLAMAYDFLDTSLKPPNPYHQFISKLQEHLPDLNHKDIWSYWAPYFYPGIFKPSHIARPHISSLRLSTSHLKVSPVKLQVPRTLILHPTSSCRTLQSLQLFSPAPTYACPISSCGRTFTSRSDVTLHIKCHN
ncbi:hypothetical protein DSO57_1031697 [Entomophthora muscae]|uniref:Uncharacterized protein n=1 Tax=Entomophthora muscae TaxID=34485 RepID=A0ACC2ULI8_9FUNG|nr:hypothetical protein DSO57_1031697 [Entomophthora muscae]